MSEEFSNRYIRKDDNNESLDFDRIFKAIKYKNKLALTVFLISIFSINFISTIYRKLNPVYQGSFSILIQDPIPSAGNTSKFGGDIAIGGIGEAKKKYTNINNVS